MIHLESELEKKAWIAFAAGSLSAPWNNISVSDAAPSACLDDDKMILELRKRTAPEPFKCQHDAGKVCGSCF